MIQRDKTIDIAKGIGIITVVWGHMAQACPIREEIYLFHMPLFFMLSGYFYKDGNSSFIDVLKKRIQSYLVPYIIFFILCISLFVLLYAVTGRMKLVHLSPGIFINPYGVVTPFWFLLSLFEVHIGYYLIHRYVKKELWRLSCCLLCLFIGYILSIKHIYTPLYVASSLSMVFFFHLGYLLNKYAVLKYSIKKQTVLLSISISFYIIGILLPIYVDVKPNKIEGNLILATFASLGGSYAILFLSTYIEKCRVAFLTKTLAFLGENTLVIFTLHILCFDIIRYFLGILTTEDASYLEGISITILGIAGSLVVGYPINRYILPRIDIFKIKRKTATS